MMKVVWKEVHSADLGPRLETMIDISDDTALGCKLKYSPTKPYRTLINYTYFTRKNGMLITDYVTKCVSVPTDNCEYNRRTIAPLKELAELFDTVEFLLRYWKLNIKEG